jgi:hypothetical protein
MNGLVGDTAGAITHPADAILSLPPSPSPSLSLSLYAAAGEGNERNVGLGFGGHDNGCFVRPSDARDRSIEINDA